jgi:hypothetical protein
MINVSRRPFAPIATGLFGLAFYMVATRPGLPTALHGDAVHGMWVGMCLGLEVMGLVLLRKTRREQAG